MPEDTDPNLKTHVYNASWGSPATLPNPQNAPTPNQTHGDYLEGSGFPKKLIKIAGLLFGLITIFFILIVFILPIFTTKKGGGGSSSGALSYWGLSEDKSVMDAVISDFEKENPNIKVEYVKQDPTDYRERLSTRIKNGTGPDIFSYHNSWYPMISDFLSPLPSSVLDPEDLKSDYYGVAQGDLERGGKVYGVPLEVDTLALLVNTQIFSETGTPYPKNWQEFINISAKLTKRDENGKIQIGGAAIGTYDNVDHAADIISLLFAQNAVDMENIQRSPTKVKDALEFYRNFALIENNVWDGTLDRSLLAFSQGKVGMVFGYARDFTLIKQQNPALSAKVIPAPQLLESNKKNIGSYWVEGLSSKSKNLKAAQTFMQYLSRPDVQEKIYQEESNIKGSGRPYSIKSLGKKLQGSDYSVFVDQASSAISTPFVDGTFDNGLNDNLDSFLKEAVNSEFLDEGAVDKLFQGYSQVLGQYQPGP